MGLKGSKLPAAVWAEACFAVAIFGYNQTAAGGVLTTPSFSRQFPSIDVIDAPEADKHYRSTIQDETLLSASRTLPELLTDETAGTIIALYTLLGIFGALACTFLGDVLGRRYTIFTAAGVNLVGSLLMASSYSLGQFIVARIVLGLGTGGIIATASVWQSELSKTESRGAHVSAFGIFCGAGLALALWLDFAFSYLRGTASWRIPFAFSGILSIFTMIGILLLPESPRWLMKKDRSPQARKILDLLHPTEPETVQKEIRDIEIALSLAGNAGCKGLFKMGPQRVFHRVVLASAVQMFLQMSGVHVITYYASSIYSEYLHFGTRKSQILAAASQLCIILGSCICSFTTSGRSLEEIDAIFTESKSIFDPLRVARRLAKKNLADLAFETEIVENEGHVDHVEGNGDVGSMVNGDGNHKGLAEAGEKV